MAGPVAPVSPPLIVTYCAALSAHDQYFFDKPAEMVAGEVRPPAIDLANEDLIAAHLHAMWLGLQDHGLPNYVVQVLDLEQGGDFPVKADFQQALDHPGRRDLALERGRRLLATLGDDLQQARRLWYHDDWLEQRLDRAYRDFADAFDRWRTLFRAAGEAAERNHRIQNDPTARRLHKAAALAYDEARKQQAILQKTDRGVSSEFYTFRYLAGEGFLPGYNFPRLPLWAYIPGSRGGADPGNYLTRARFLALSEFGTPQPDLPRGQPLPGLQGLHYRR